MVDFWFDVTSNLDDDIIMEKNRGGNGVNRFKDEINIYPNPVEGYLQVELLGIKGVEFQYELFYPKGQVVLFGFLNSGCPEIDTQDLRNGVCLFVIENNREIIFDRKIIKMQLISNLF